MIWMFAPFRPSDGPRRPKRPSRSPQERPRGLQGGPRTAQEAPKTAPRGLQDSPRWLPRRLRWPKVASKTVPRRIQNVQDAPKRARDGSIRFQHGPRWTEDGLNVVFPRIHRTFRGARSVHARARGAPLGSDNTRVKYHTSLKSHESRSFELDKNVRIRNNICMLTPRRGC